MRRSWSAVAAGVGLLSALSGCAGSSRHSNKASVATVHVQSLLTSTHLTASGQQKTDHAPMSGQTVLAFTASGSRVSALIDAAGEATLHLPTGAYTVTNSLKNACKPYRLDARAGEEISISLACVAP